MLRAAVWKKGLFCGDSGTACQWTVEAVGAVGRRRTLVTSVPGACEGFVGSVIVPLLRAARGTLARAGKVGHAGLAFWCSCD